MMGIETLKNIFTSKRSSFFEGKNGIVFETIKDIFHTSKHRKETQVEEETPQLRAAPSPERLLSPQFRPPSVTLGKVFVVLALSRT